MKYEAQVAMDHQHGPIVRVTVDDTIIAVYLADETAVMTNSEGQAGLEVKGPWQEFKRGIAIWIENDDV